MNAVLQYVLYVGILVAISVPLGIYMSKVMDGETNIVSRVLGPVERGIYKLLRIKTWAGKNIWLRVFMATLRKKLEPTPDSPQYIQTHIGVGYRMVRVE